MALHDLLEKRDTLLAQARERLDNVTANTDESRTAELESQHDAAMSAFDANEKLIERELRMKAAEDKAAEIEERARDARRPGSRQEVRAADEGNKPEYRDAFYAMLAAGGDVSELSPELRSVLRAGVDAEARAQSTSGTAGGYTIPTTLANMLERSMKMWGPMYDSDIATVITTTSGNAIDIPTIDDTAVAVEKRTENTALTDDGSFDATFGKKTLNAYAYDSGWVKFSMELAQDSIFNVENLLSDLLGERIARRMNVELTTGDGVGDPSGVVTGSTLGKTAASATALTADEILDLIHSVDPAYRMSPKFRLMMNDSTLAVIRKLKDGNGQYLWSAGSISNGVPGTIWGYGYAVNQAMASIATGTKPIIAGDFSKYYVRKVGAPVLGVRREYYWPDMGIAGIVRVDGKLINTAAVKHLVQA